MGPTGRPSIPGAVGRRACVSEERRRRIDQALVRRTGDAGAAIDAQFSDVVLNFRRRLDAIVDRCFSDHVRLYSKDTLLAVEIVSPDSPFKTDRVEQEADYADAGFAIYLIVLLNAAQDGLERSRSTA